MRKPFTRVAAIVLAVIAILQLFRFLFRWEVTLQGAIVPVWLSGVAFVVAAGLAVMVLRESRA